MLDIADELHRWGGHGAPFAVATVVATGGSAPRQPGAALAVDGEGNAIGSVSGGCVEGAVYELCRRRCPATAPRRSVLKHFGYSDDDAFAVGLTCGGVIDILVQRIDPAARPEIAGALAAAAAGEAAALARITDGPGRTAGPRPAGPCRRLVRGLARRRASGTVRPRARPARCSPPAAPAPS